MLATQTLVPRFLDSAQSEIHPSKNLTRQFRATISGALLIFIFLLAMSIAASAQDPTAYEFVGRSDNWGAVDLTTGAFSQTGNTGELLTGLGVGAGGLLYGGLFTGQTLYQVNPANGSVTTVGTSGLPEYYGMGSTTSGVYAFDTNANFYSVNTTTGATTLIGSTGLSMGGTTGTSTGSDTLYFVDGLGDLYSINTSTAAATEIGSTGLTTVGAMVFENGALYAGNSGSPVALYTLDTTTGTATFVADAPNSADFWGLAPSVFPVAGLSPSSLKMTSTLVGQTSPSKTITLTNSGSVSLSISTVSVSGDFSETDACAGQTIAPSGTCMVSVTFTPSVTGSISGALTIVDNAQNTPQVLALSGTGLPELSISPASESFGTVTVGTTSAAKTMTLTNNTGGTLDYTFQASSNYAVVEAGNPLATGRWLRRRNVRSASPLLRPLTAQPTVASLFRAAHSPRNYRVSRVRDRAARLLR
jgi:hypothetical protein